MRFWDASAIVPLCVDEPQSRTFRSLLESDPSPVVWWGSPIECASAFARLRRDGTIQETEEDAARKLLNILAEAWIEVQPTDELRETALRVLRLHALRSADSLQLAAALVWARGRTRGLELVSGDRRLADAARREGFAVSTAA